MRMMILYLVGTLFGATLFGATPISLESRVTMAPLPETSDFFLEQALSFDVDRDGNYYLLDGGAQVIFSWDKEGRFRKVIGNPGNGPGEFVLRGRGGAQGFLTSVGDELYVFDGGKREIMVFDRGGSFKKTVQLNLPRGRTMNFFVTDDGRFLFHRRSRGEKGIVSEVQLLDSSGKVEKTLRSEEDRSISFKGGSGRRPNITFRPFNPTLVSQFNKTNGELLLGQSDHPSFEVIPLNGKPRRIEVPLIQEEVTQADKDEFLEQFSNERRRRIKLEFPEKKAYYDQLLSLGEKGFLVYTQSPYHKKIKGLHLDAKGEVKGRFQLNCGLGGALLASQGRMLCVQVNSQDDFSVAELDLKN